MKPYYKILATDPNNWTALAIRMSLGIVIFPHGAQKMLGWFDGNGLTGTLSSFTEGMGLPAIIAILIVLIEFFGALFLILGLFTRIAALGVLGLFAGIAITHLEHGFFMNWMGNQEGEGIEYFILLLSMTGVTLFSGAGKFSLDALLLKTKTKN